MPSIKATKGWSTVRLFEVAVDVTSSSEDPVDVEAIEDAWTRYTVQKSVEATRKRKTYSPSDAERQEYLGALDPEIRGVWDAASASTVVSDFFTVRFAGTAFLGAPSGSSGSAEIHLAVVIDGDEWVGHIDMGWSDPVLIGATTWSTTSGGLYGGDDVPVGDANLGARVAIEVALTFEAREPIARQQISPRIWVNGRSRAKAYSIDSAPVKGLAHAHIDPPFQIDATPEPILVDHGEYSACTLSLRNLSRRRNLFYRSWELGTESQPNTDGPIRASGSRELHFRTQPHRATDHAGIDPDAISFGPARVHHIEMSMEDGYMYRELVAEEPVPAVACLGSLIDTTPPDPLPEDPGGTGDRPPASGERFGECWNSPLLGLRAVDVTFEAHDAVTSEPSISGQWGPAPRPGSVVSDWLVWTVTLRLNLGYGSTWSGDGSKATVLLTLRDRQSGLEHAFPISFGWNDGWELRKAGLRTLSQGRPISGADRHSEVTLQVGLVFQGRDIGSTVLEGEAGLVAARSEQGTVGYVPLDGPTGSAPISIGPPVELRVDAPDQVNHGSEARAALIATNVTAGGEVRWEGGQLGDPVQRPGLCGPRTSQVVCFNSRAHEEPHWGLAANAIVFEPNALLDVRVPLEPCGDAAYEWWHCAIVPTGSVAVDCQGPPVPEGDLLGDDVELPDPPPGPHEPEIELEEPDAPRPPAEPEPDVDWSDEARQLGDLFDPPAEEPDGRAGCLFLAIALVLVGLGGGLLAFFLLGGGSDEPETAVRDQPTPVVENERDQPQISPEPDERPPADEPDPSPPPEVLERIDAEGLVPVAIAPQPDGRWVVIVRDGDGGISWSIFNAEGEIVPASQIETTWVIWALVTELWLNAAINNSSFPCGAVTNEFRVTCPVGAGPLDAGEYFIIGVRLEGRVADGDAAFTYGLAFDDDGDDSDNYQFSPPFDSDFFRNTEHWYRLHIAADGTRSMWADGARDGVLGLPRASSAAVIEWGDTIIWLIPRAEVPGDSPAYRVTAFHNRGVPGAVPVPESSGGDVSGETVTEPLIPIDGDIVELSDTSVLPPDIPDPLPRVAIELAPDEHVTASLVGDFMERAAAATSSGDPEQVIGLVLPELLAGDTAAACRADMEASIVLADGLTLVAMPTGPDTSQGFPFFVVDTTIDYSTGSVPYPAVLSASNVDGRLYLVLPSCLG